MTTLNGETAVDAVAREYMFLALTLGYNELVKLGRTLGEKALFRVLRDAATEQYVKNGFPNPYIHDKPAFDVVIGVDLPRVVFLERDVELMRAYIAEYDAEKANV